MTRFLVSLLQTDLRCGDQCLRLKLWICLSVQCQACSTRAAPHIASSQRALHRCKSMGSVSTLHCWAWSFYAQTEPGRTTPHVAGSGEMAHSVISGFRSQTHSAHLLMGGMHCALLCLGKMTAHDGCFRPDYAAPAPGPRDSVMLPALTQTLGTKAIERRKRTQGLQRTRVGREVRLT